MAVAYTLGSLVDDTFRKLRGTTRDRVTTLAATLDAPSPGTSEVITLSDITGVVISSLLVQQGETMYVQAVSPSLLQATVIRGYDDTTPQSALINTIVSIDPPWTRDVVKGHIKDEIRSWGPQVYAIKSAAVPIVQYQRGYDLSALTGGIIRILAVTAQQPPYIGDSAGYVIAGSPDYSQQNPFFSFEYRAIAPTNEFPSGKALIITGTNMPTVTGNLTVIYASPFDVDSQWLEGTDMIANVGMDSRDLDIPAVGAAGRLLQMISVRRAMLNVQGQSREEQDVTMQAILQAAQKFQTDTKSRLGDVQQRLLSDWPYRSSNF